MRVQHDREFRAAGFRDSAHHGLLGDSPVALFPEGIPRNGQRVRPEERDLASGLSLANVPPWGRRVRGRVEAREQGVARGFQVAQRRSLILAREEDPGDTQGPLGLTQPDHMLPGGKGQRLVGDGYGRPERNPGAPVSDQLSVEAGVDVGRCVPGRARDGVQMVRAWLGKVELVVEPLLGGLAQVLIVIVVEPVLDRALRFSEKYAVVMQKGKYGYVDGSGKLLGELAFDFAQDFSEGLAAVKIGKAWGYIDKTGELVIQSQFDLAQPFANGLARVGWGRSWGDATWGYIDTDGKVVYK